MARSDGGAYRRYSDSLPFEKTTPATIPTPHRTRYLPIIFACLSIPYLTWQFYKQQTKSNLWSLVVFSALFLVYFIASAYERFVDRVEAEADTASEEEEGKGLGKFVKSFF